MLTKPQSPAPLCCFAKVITSKWSESQFRENQMVYWRESEECKIQSNPSSRSSATHTRLGKCFFYRWVSKMWDFGPSRNANPAKCRRKCYSTQPITRARRRTAIVINNFVVPSRPESHYPHTHPQKIPKARGRDGSRRLHDGIDGRRRRGDVCGPRLDGGLFVVANVLLQSTSSYPPLDYVLACPDAAA